jgi:hypothetical protein
MFVVLSSGFVFFATTVVSRPDFAGCSGGLRLLVVCGTPVVTGAHGFLADFAHEGVDRTGSEPPLKLAEVSARTRVG